MAAELRIGATVSGRWRREMRERPTQAFVGNGRSRDEELSRLRRELPRVTTSLRPGKLAGPSGKRSEDLLSLPS